MGWAPKWTKKQIARGRAQEARAKERYYDETQTPVAAAEMLSASPLARAKPKESLWQKIKSLFLKLMLRFTETRHAQAYPQSR